MVQCYCEHLRVAGWQINNEFDHRDTVGCGAIAGKSR
jgi:hypothetical protein